MSEPLLTLAASPDAFQGALRMGGISSEKQPLDNGAHPFARLLAGHAPGAGTGLEADEAPTLVTLAGKLAGQFLAADGKELPDAARLLAMAGLPLQDGEPLLLPLPDADADLSLLADPALAVADAEGLPATDPALATESGHAWTPGAAHGAPAIDPPTGQDRLSPAPRSLTGAEGRLPGDPGAPALAAAAGRSAAEIALTPPVQDPVLEAELPILPEPARVASAVQQALQQRAGEEGARESRLGDLVRAVAATQGAEPAPRVETPAGLGPQASASVQAQTPALPATSVAIPLRQAGWDQALGEQVQWMVGNKLQGAEMRLNPAHLGPMEVRIQIQNDQANINFSAQHGVVREALEAAIPRLREMLGESGLQLNNVTVSDQSLAEQRHHETGQTAFADWSSAGTRGMEEDEPVLSVSPLREGAGTIDYFA
jgi:flagellar hook-length control protein FliK